MLPATVSIPGVEDLSEAVERDTTNPWGKWMHRGAGILASIPSHRPLHGYWPEVATHLAVSGNEIPFRSTPLNEYHRDMIARLNQELTAALHATGDRELELIDPETQRQYVLVDSDTFHQAMDALRRQQDREAITAGLAQWEAGEGRPLDEAFEALRTRLGFAPPP